MTTESPLTRREHAMSWLRHNLFRGPVDTVVTILAGGISAWVLYKTIRFVNVYLRRVEAIMLLFMKCFWELRSS